MQKLMTGLLILIFNLSCFGQNINSALKQELDSIYAQDQNLRQVAATNLYRIKADSLADAYKIPKSELTNYIFKTIPIIDSLNIVRVAQIIKQYGYPGKSLVGEKTNEAAFYVIQHSKRIDKYLPDIKKAAEKKELPFNLYAMMINRSLMYHGKEQIYGTQGKDLGVHNTKNGTKEYIAIIWPIKDPSNVNMRRKKAGFELTVEEYAKLLGTEYKPLTIAQVKAMQIK